MKLVDAVSLRSRRRKLAALSRRAAADGGTTVLDVGVDEVGFGGEGGHSGCGTHNFFEELYPWPSRITALGLTTARGFRSRYPEIAYIEGDACALPFPDQSSTSSSRTPSSSTSATSSGNGFRGRGAAGRPSRFRDDAEPLVPDRGPHAAAARPLAAEGGLRSGLRPRGQGLGAREPPARERRSACGSSRARSGSSTSASRSSRSHERAPAPHRARGLRRRARAPQPRDGRAVADRHSRRLARRRRSLEGRAARRSRSPSRCSAHASLPVQLWADRLALAYAALRAPLLAPAPELAGRIGDAPWPALRRAARPDPGRRLLPRSPARAHARSPGAASRWRSSASPWR